MATILDVSLLQSFDIVFIPLLVFAIVFAILQKTKALTNGIGINSLVAAVIAFLILLSETATQLISFMIPWFTVVLVFIILLLLTFQVFGAKEADILSAVKADKTIIWAIIGVALVIVIAGFGTVLGQTVGPYLGEGSNATTVSGASGVSTPDFQTNVMATLFHPKILGLMVIFIIIIMAVLLLTQG